MQFTLMGLKFDLAAIVFVGEPNSRGTVQRLSHVSARLFYSSEREGFEERKRRPEISISVFFSSSFSLSLSQLRFLFFSFFVSFLHILLSIRERDVPIRDGPPSSSVLRSRSSFVRLLSDDVEPLDDVLKEERKKV